MPYYQGDYYRGDYYRGDPGLFGFLGKAVKGAVGLVARSGIPVASQIAKVAQAVVSRPAAPRSLPPPSPTGMSLSRFGPLNGQGPVPVPRGTPGATPAPGIGGTIARTLPGGASGFEGGATRPPVGYHWNKSYSYAKGLPEGSFLVKNRSMNPLNPRALRRTVRRQRGAVGLMRGVLSGSGYTIKRVGLPGKRSKRRR
ncbi:MAG: hypothetical protein ACREXU_02850 [Gammaproteobacteria bacterium]